MTIIEIVLYFAVYIKLVIFLIIAIAFIGYYKLFKSDIKLGRPIKMLIILLITYNFIDVINSAVVNDVGKAFYVTKNKIQDSIYINNQLINDETNLRIDSLLGKKTDKELMDSINIINKNNPEKFNKALLPYIRILQKRSEVKNLTN